ncbi:hypothetical protein CEUSTIGMA_g5194.t1 [Chlamydomonas eustigma]|uniref:Uncharacterized protein n=1 Tax=Chlamydomonas eustigma TaxID=1157962 RepID=A0A250X3W4_9CHLO|nr:hypothetical protein CEUSTIGMA_g5194.t1 [Chlamydomonas eustigma]|eukprot:GAX77751.1 hypothetical protein CEUSTIGMA_g5194.t1 [Chlamydomonas eustigma]
MLVGQFLRLNAQLRAKVQVLTKLTITEEDQGRISKDMVEYVGGGSASFQERIPRGACMEQLGRDTDSCQALLLRPNTTRPHTGLQHLICELISPSAAGE